MEMPIAISHFAGNWVDLIIVIFLITFFLSGFSKGFIINLIDLVGFVFSFLIALKFYPYPAKLLVVDFSLPLGIANALGFIILGFLVETLFFVLVRFFYEFIPQFVLKSRLNKLLGPLPALANGVIVVAFFLSVIIATPINPQIKKAILDSKLGAPLIARTQVLEQELSSVFGEAVLDTLSFLTVKPESSETIPLQFQLDSGSPDEVSERVMLDLINKERQKINLELLISDNNLQKVARLHAQDMFHQGYFSHISPAGLSPFDRLTENGITFLVAGENLAFAPTVELAHQGLMQSPGHRANILSSDFHKVGIGVIDGGMYGKMFVQEFTN